MKKATDAAVEAIKNMSQKVSGKKQIANVASISAGDKEVGELLQMQWKRFPMTALSL